jgi:hypothetical protein
MEWRRPMSCSHAMTPRLASDLRIEEGKVEAGGLN